MNKKGIAFKVIYTILGFVIGLIVRIDIILFEISAINFVVAGAAFIISYIFSGRQSIRFIFVGFGIANIIIAFGVI